MKKIVLASKSPRRLEILRKYNINLSILHSDIEEVIKENDEPQTSVMSLAFQKAIDVSKRCEPNDIVIAADTIVYIDRILGKPNNKEEAFNMLRMLSNNYHYVYTGICIIEAGKNKKILDYDVTKVTFKELSDDMIYKYLLTNEYKDKAGAYGIQGFGELLIKKIDGSFNNVKGLPISMLNDLLINNFNINLL